MPPLIPTRRTGSAHSEVAVPEVMKVSEAVVSEVMKACEVVVSEVMEVSEVVMPEVMKMCEVVVVPEVPKVILRVGGQRHRRGKHRHHNNASNSHFAEHDNPPGCSIPCQVRTQRNTKCLDD